jgi:hypothetical protein
VNIDCPKPAFCQRLLSLSTKLSDSPVRVNSEPKLAD